MRTAQRLFLLVFLLYLVYKGVHLLAGQWQPEAAVDDWLKPLIALLFATGVGGIYRTQKPTSSHGRT